MKPPFNYKLEDFKLDEQNELAHYQPNGVLINSLGIKDTSTLNSAERDLARLRQKEFIELNQRPKYTAEYYFNIHKYIFQDIYPWAGQPRCLDIVKSDNLFVPYHFIEKELNQALQTLRDDIRPKPLTKKSLALNLAIFVGKINNIHPFAEGNGRTQRLFVSKVARTFDCSIGWDRISDGKMRTVATSAHAGDFEPLAKLISNSLDPLPNKFKNKDRGR